MPRYLLAALLLLILLALLGTVSWFMMGPGTAPVFPADPADTPTPVIAEPAPRERLRNETESAAPSAPALPGPTGVEPPPKPESFVRVRVVDANGALVEGALVQVIATSTRLTLAEEPVVLTGSGGEARVRIWTESGEFRVRVVRGEELAMSGMLFPAGADEEPFVELRLRPSLLVRGRVVGPDGRAMPSAAVRLRTSEVSTDAFDFGGRTDADGRFAIGPLTAAEIADGATMMAFAGRGTAPHEEHVDAGRLASGEVVLRVPAAVRVVGRVLSPAHEPVEGVRVTRPDGFNSVETDEDGRFEFSFVGPRETYVLVLPDEPIPPGNELAIVRAPLVRRSDGVLDAGDVVLGSGRSLTVRVVHADGSPAQLTYVFASYGPAARIRDAQVDWETGRATLRGLGPGPVDLLAEAWRSEAGPGWGPPIRGVLRGVVPGDDEVEIVLREGLAARIRVVDVVSRAPVRPLRGRARLRPQVSGNHGTVTAWPTAGWVQPPGLPKDNSLLLVAESTGLHDLVVEAAGYHPAVVRDIEITDDGVTEVEVALRAR